jgi:hypothetical protein
MAKKKDPSITFLNRFGYNVVKLPRVGIEPLDLVGRDETTQWLGPLASVWKSSVPVPPASAPRPAAPINGQKTDQMQVSFGLKILANALAAFGATVPSLDAAYTRARKVQFAYSNVTSTVVAPLDAGNYLAAGSLNTANPVVAHYLKGEEAQAFLIVDVLKSDSLTVTATDDHGIEVGVDVPAIQGLVGASVKVTSSGSANSTLTFKGAEPVTFGFIVNEIEFDGASWSLQGAAPSGGLAFGTAGGAAVASDPPVLLGAGCRVRI